MGDKTLILKVDLECSRCRKEIGRILGKLQGKENIRTIVYDEKNNTVTISGPFDPDKLSAKLSYRAGKVIKDIKEKKEPPKESKPAKAEDKPKKEEKPAEQPKKEEKKPEKEKKPDEKPAEKKPEKKDEKPAEKKPEKKDEKPAEKKPEKKDEKPAEKKPDKKDDKPAKSESEAPKKSEPAPAPYPYPYPYPYSQPTCCPAPYYEGYYGGYRCCMCGHVFGYAMAPPYSTYHPPPYGTYHPPPYDGYRVYHISSEEDPSAAPCTVM